MWQIVLAANGAHLAGVVVDRSLLQLFLGVHHYGSAPGHRFPQRLAGDQQKTDRLLFSGDGDAVAGPDAVIDIEASWSRLTAG